MTSSAYDNFEKRLAEVQQLVDADGALVRLKRAQEAHVEAAGDVTKIGKVIDALVSAPGAGRSPQVQALEGAAITLLSGHLQGFLVDLHDEAARVLFDRQVDDVDVLVEVAPTRGNPNLENVNRPFASLGFREIEPTSWLSRRRRKGCSRRSSGRPPPDAGCVSYRAGSSLIVNVAFIMDREGDPW